MKRILLLILILVGTGCKTIQQPAIKAESQPESLSEMIPERVLHTLESKDSDVIESVLEEVTLSDTIPTSITDSLVQVQAIDSIIGTNVADSLSTFAGSDTIPIRSGALEATVEYQAKDSIVWTAENMAFLYSESDVKYQNIALKADIIRMDMSNSVLHATFSTDSLGEELGYPVFSEGDQELEAKEMSYNFKSRKASAKHVVTQQGEGYLTADITKKMANDVMNMQDGRYTTCDEHDHPHFYISMTKAKVRPGKDIVSGPLYFVVEDVPLFPLVLPFAFFPFTDTYSSGILMPSYSDDMTRGFGLRDGGYYFALSDYYDLALTGEYYMKGSWGISGKSSYRKRYKYSGNFDLSYLTTKTGDKGLPDYQKQADFKLRWSHTQDPKANPYRTFSVSFDYSTSSYDRNQLNSLYTPDATTNNKGSSINVTKRFPNKPVSISATMNVNQQSRDSSVSVTLPNVTVSLSRIYPLKRKQAIGAERWYEKISVNYTGQLQNKINTKEDKLFNSNLIKDWQNGMSHRSDINATYSIFDNINISPNVSYSERWYSHRTDYAFDSLSRRMAPIDTTYGFYRAYEYSASVSASTTLYGMFTPVRFLQKLTGLKVIRHRLEPTVSFSARPDFGAPRHGFYNDYTYTNYASAVNGYPAVTTGSYSPFSGQVFGPPGRGKSGSINFGLKNNIEAKVADEYEPSGERKISLIDDLSGNMSYNLVADSFQWSDLNTSIRFKFFKNYTLNLNVLFDTYTYDYNEDTKQVRRVNKPRWTVGKGIGRFRSTGTSYSFTFNNDTFKKWFGGEKGRRSQSRSNNNDMYGEDEYDPNDPFNTDEEIIPDTNNEKKSRLSKKKETEGDYDYDGYFKTTIPWSLSFNYSINVGYDMSKFDPKKMEYDYKLTHNLSFNGNVQPTKNWRISFNATYDFDYNKLAYMTCNISRTMHCFQMSASVIPVGPLKSYSFSISANSAMLKDLKYDQRSTPYNGQTWY